MAKGVGLQQLMSKCDKIDRELKSLRGLIKKIQDLPEVVEKDDVHSFVAFFCEKWKAKYLHSPKLDGKNIGALRNFLKDFRADRARIMVEAYLKMNDSFFIKKRHDPITLIQNALSVGHFADSGKMITNEDARQVERTAKTMSLFDQVDQGTL